MYGDKVFGLKYLLYLSAQYFRTIRCDFESLLTLICSIFVQTSELNTTHFNTKKRVMKPINH